MNSIAACSPRVSLNACRVGHRGRRRRTPRYLHAVTCTRLRKAAHTGPDDGGGIADHEPGHHRDRPPRPRRHGTFLVLSASRSNRYR